jgi:raffinose/stachyose/melibiose transport system permease protein
MSRPVAQLIASATESFNMPQDMLQPPGIRQTMTDARFRLMTGELTPQAFGERLEAAAAGDRARAEAPDTIDVRHGGKAAALTGLLVAVAAWLGWRARRKAGRERGGSDPEGRPRLGAGASVGFVGPAFALYAAFVLLPGLIALGWAFTFWDGLSEQRWAGWLHFKWLLLESDVFWVALGNNVFLMLVPALLIVPVALVCAAILHRGVAGGGLFRVVLLFPNMLGGIAAALLWLNAYEPDGGLVNAALSGFGRLVGSETLAGFAGFPWLSPDHLYPALLPVYLWMACGFNLILYLAAMEGVPDELYEAAEIEGASRLRQFFSITLPLIWEVIVISAVFLVIGGLNAFEMVWLLTQQDPVSSVHTLSTLMVSTMFKEFDVGRATAIAVVLFVLVLAGSAAVMGALRREAIER